MKRFITNAGSRVLLFGVGLALGSDGWLQAQESARPLASANVLTQAVQVLSLTKEDAKRPYRVHLKGVVTCYDRRADLCFIQDSTSGVYVYPRGGDLLLKPGDLVEVTGVTGPGHFSPYVDPESIRPVGNGRLPVAKPVKITDLNTGKEDCQWVELEAVVQRAQVDWGHLVLDLVAGPARVQVRVLKPTF